MSDQLKKKIEMYSENLSDYISKVHEAVEGRYELTGYDLSVIEAALNQLSDVSPSPDNTARTAGAISKQGIIREAENAYFNHKFKKTKLKKLMYEMGFIEGYMKASQFKPQQDSKEVTDEDIEKGMLKVLRYNNGRTYSVSPRLYFTKGAKWMRDKILNKTK